MCCFSRPVRFVGGTKIFARAADDDPSRQLLAYSMELEIGEDLAMVLPLPVPPAPGDDAVQFVALDGYARFFDDLEAAFPPDYSFAPLARSHGPDLSVAKLVVHQVGMFEASFVPTRADFARLDPRFRLPEGVFDRLPRYADWGFAVFRLRRAKKRERIHPMAFSFPRRDPSALFFPTVHVHDGEVKETASYDHMLFCQADGLLDATLPWTRSHGALGASVDVAKARGLVDGGRGARRQAIHPLNGARKNADVELRPPGGVTVADLFGQGDGYAYAVRAESAYLEPPLDIFPNDMAPAWHLTARTRLPALAAVLREGLPALVDARRNAWSLTRLDPSLPAHFVNGNQLWTGTDYMNGKQAKPGGPGRVAFRIFTKRVEQQDIMLGFARTPDQEALDGIRAELARLVDRAAA